MPVWADVRSPPLRVVLPKEPPLGNDPHECGLNAVLGTPLRRRTPDHHGIDRQYPTVSFTERTQPIRHRRRFLESIIPLIPHHPEPVPPQSRRLSGKRSSGKPARRNTRAAPSTLSSIHKTNSPSLQPERRDAYRRDSETRRNQRRRLSASLPIRPLTSRLNVLEALP